MESLLKISPIERDENDKRAIYVLVYEKLFNFIMDESIKDGDKLPGENTLAKELGVSRGSLRQALLILQEDGIINMVQGKGNIVTKNKKILDSGIEKLCNPIVTFSKCSFDKVDINVVYETPNKMLQETLDINSNSLIMVMHKTYMRNETCICYSLSFLPYDRVSQYNLELNDNNKLLKFVDEDIYSISTNSRAEIKLTTTGDFMAEKFKISDDLNIFLFEEILFSESGYQIMFTKSYLIPEHFDLIINRK